MRLTHIIKNKNLLIIISILVLATALRLYNITIAPPAFNRDEAAFGYDTYSILKTAKDQHGVFLPTAFESFGVWENPIQYYFKIPFIALFGLNIFSVRLSIVFIAVITIFLIYTLARGLLKDERLALTSAILCTFSIYHFYMSRTGFSQSMYGLFFLLGGTCALLFGNKKYVKILGGLILGLSAYSYPAYFFFLPAYLVILTAVFYKQFKKDRASKIALLTSLLVLASSYFVFWTPNKLRIPGGSFFYQNDSGIRFRWSDKPAGEILAQGGKYGIVERILYNPRVGFIYKVAENYIDAFSTEFWLKKGRGYESNVEDFGNLLLYEPFLIILGTGYLIWSRKRIVLFLIGWVLIGPTASMFTKDVASTRLFHMVVPFILLEAAGFIFLFDSFLKFTPRLLKPLAIIIILSPILFLNVLFYDSYFRHFPYRSRMWWDNGYLEVVKFIEKYPDKNVYWTSRQNMGYIYILFYTKYDPKRFQLEAKRVPGNYNIRFVTKFSRYTFLDEIDWANMCNDLNAIYISEFKDVPKEIFPLLDGHIEVSNTSSYTYFITSEDKCKTFRYTPPKLPADANTGGI